MDTSRHEPARTVGAGMPVAASMQTTTVTEQQQTCAVAGMRICRLSAELLVCSPQLIE